MSCSLNNLAHFTEHSDLIRWLCPHLSTSTTKLETEGDEKESMWNDEWLSWDLENTENSRGSSCTSSPSGSESSSWLNQCLIAVSPVADIMVVAYKNRMAILTGRYECSVDGEERTKFHVTWKGTVGQSDGDEISCLLCLPLVSQKQSSAGGPDWTCIIIGFSSGYVSFFTESGMFLFSQFFEEGEVINLKCRTVIEGGGNLGIASDFGEELIILYPQSVTTIDGLSLYTTLRGCRNQAAKAAASGGEGITVPPLGYKKWGLNDQKKVSDCVSSGVISPNLYDHMAQASLTKGFKQSVNSGVPAAVQLVTAGKVPYVGFMVAREGIAPSYVGDAAFHYANKLKNALVSAASGWLFGKPKSPEKEKEKKPKVELSTPIPCRWSLPDKRVGLTIQLSNSRRLAAVSDDFGRITVVDVNRGVALKMWKGYRDADCGWIEVEGEWGGTQRKVSFLIIYAPRRGLLEIWTSQQGPRVEAFNVPKHSRLLYTPHTMLGLNRLRTINCGLYPVLFLTPEGTLMEINVPFHLALSDKTSRRARDLHLLKTLKAQMRNPSNEEEVVHLIKEMRTSSVIHQALVMLIGTSRHMTASLLEDILTQLVPNYIGSEGENAGESVDHAKKQDHETKLLVQLIQRLQQLLQLYNNLNSLHIAHEASPDEDKETICKELSNHLMMDPSETQQALSLCIIGKDESRPHKKVTFDSADTMGLGSFLRSWEVTVTTLVRSCHNTVPISCKGELSHEKKLRLAQFLYGWAWKRKSITVFQQSVKESGTDLKDLLHLFLLQWTTHSFLDEVSVLHMTTTLSVLSSLSEEVLCDVSALSPWWVSVRDILSNSSMIPHSYLAALACRGIHANLEIKNEKNKARMDCSSEKETEEMEVTEGEVGKIGTASLNDWEGLSMEMVEWNLILQRLELLQPLARLLAVPALSTHRKISAKEVSCKILQNQGKGYAAELVSTWLVTCGIPLSVIVEMVKENEKKKNKTPCETEEMVVDDDDDKVEDTEDNNEDILLMSEVEDMLPAERNLVIEIQKHLASISISFPNSMKPFSLLTNMAWELGALWHKDQNTWKTLTDAIFLISQIDNAYIKHGLSVMFWETWIARQVQTICTTMEKVGRHLKSQNCYRELGMNENSVAPFLGAVRDLLDIIMEANVICEVDKPPLLGVDKYWSNIEVSPALTDCTISQKMTSYDMVFHHQQLVCVVHLISLYSLKNVKPFSYFDTKGRSVFFKPFHTAWTLSGSVDSVVSKTRLAFLCRVISAAVAGLPDEEDINYGVAEGVREALDLGKAWGLSVDSLHRHHVCKLYNSGHDSLAEEVLHSVSDRTTLGSQLVMIAGERLRHELANSSRTAHHLALTSPAIYEWIKTLDEKNLRCPGVSLEKTLVLLSHALNLLLPDAGPEYKMAEAIHETLSAFLQSNNATP
ncbi:rab3 GTPase activating protein [Oratosquilla oratoria]|uniref:rab3 GTPase activating protein n=1 Tax=Oratosquilla oratoria TaxID=337810 RepID=UPI003F761C6D